MPPRGPQLLPLLPSPPAGPNNVRTIPNKDKLRPDGRRMYADNGLQFCFKFQTSGCRDPCPSKQQHQCELFPGIHKSVDCERATDATRNAIQASLDKALVVAAERAANPQPKKKGAKKQ